MKVIIVGGVAGGATAAARIRRLDEEARIIVFEKSGFVSYANCGLPYYIGGVIENKDDLTVQTPESLWNRFRIEVRVKHEVLSINKETKTVKVKNLTTNEIFEEDYDKLVLSPGAKPIKPNLAGIDSDRIFSLRNVEDTLKIREFIDKKQPKSAILVGGGYIGIEVAENLCEKGIKVTIIQRPNQLMNTLDYDMATFVHAKLRQKGVDIKLNTNVTGFKQDNEKINVLLDNDSILPTDMVLMAVGVAPDSHLAKKAGLELGLKETIVVNDQMETSASDIYAVGDSIEVKHFITGNKAVISLAGPANKQGRIVADNICGIDSHYKGTMGSSIIKIFDMTVASTGLTEKASKEAGLKYDSVILSPSSHAGYYPNAKVMTIKVVFEKETLKILGAQIIGYDGVDKRLDVIATAISAGLKADGLKDLELAYAPPYSSAKDPVNMVGFVIENIATGKMKQYHYDDIAKIAKDENVILLDTRTENEYSRGHVGGFINIPVDDLRERFNELDVSRPVYVMCQSGLRSYIACRILSQKGFNCYNFAGGYRFYKTIHDEECLTQSAFPCGMDK